MRRCSLHVHLPWPLQPGVQGPSLCMADEMGPRPLAPHPTHSHCPIYVFRMDGFKFGGFLTLFTYAVYLELANLERHATGRWLVN